MGRLQGEVQALVVETAGDSEPVDLVVGGGGVVAGPGVAVGGLPGIGQAEAVALTGGHVLDLEVEPLEVVALQVRAHGQ
ncbi:hypothetical protein D3C72_2285260 [compost metagenome]